jgi:hypothetical protein
MIANAKYGHTNACDWKRLAQFFARTYSAVPSSCPFAVTPSRSSSPAPHRGCGGEQNIIELQSWA